MVEPSRNLSQKGFFNSVILLWSGSNKRKRDNIDYINSQGERAQKITYFVTNDIILQSPHYYEGNLAGRELG